MWPQILMIVLMTLRFSGGVHRAVAKEDSGEIVAVVVAIAVVTAILYFGGFWIPLSR